ncbi:hypothetical protein CCR75_001041 [Bremia lactucae]|uniref:Sister chromatid cohesion protein DCC1 n=1 Tax=Bremia lactucae TaxID=4779 RepID=A0A976IH73_BRELC|nr:hypothetical protein CCR75_001041 [Bremia lactucae]
MIVTTDDFNEDKYKLLQLNSDIERAITTGSQVFLVGTPDARAVLCTEDQSYYITKEDTSNLRLLTTHTDWSVTIDTHTVQVSGAARFHYLLEPKVPDATKLQALLLKAPYEKLKRKAISTQQSSPMNVYTTRDLVAALQVSEQEILAMLKELHAFEDAGVWRLLESTYQSQVFTDMLDLVVQNDWNVFIEPGVLVKQFVNHLDEPSLVIRQCCQLYGSINTILGQEYCLFDRTKVATFRAKSLFDDQIAEAHFQAQLQHAAFPLLDAGWELNEFVQKWKLRVPDSVPVALEMLRGLALIKHSKAGKPSRIVYFPEDLLSPEPKKRFEQLFQTQEKWTIEQLEPYIKQVIGYSYYDPSVVAAEAHAVHAPKQFDREIVQPTVINEAERWTEDQEGSHFKDCGDWNFLFSGECFRHHLNKLRKSE